MKPVTVRAKADEDIDRALEFYALEAPQQTRKFLAALRKTFSAIAQFPQAGSTRFALELELPGVRHRVVKRFPWFVFYVEQAEEIAVIRVLHQHRDISGEF